ncbi:hypothetical protein [Sphingomonas profundi]|uniref:hypothetical protein n=1 Tax=Alterirhizorhabdus profundi TaxID=2681549 RepID=UPI0012E8BA98|nr:hypothetical protein [Sphingomonas profundi]
MLDPAASQQCCDLIRTQPDLFEPDNPLLRMPADRFWLEWFEEPDPTAPPGTLTNTRMAVLVEASASGRQAALTRFSEDSAGNVDLAPGTLSFDLDHLAVVPKGSESSFRLRHGELPHVTALLRHATLHMDPAWTAAFQRCTRAEYQTFVAKAAAAMWFVMPFTLAFAALLNSRTVLREQHTDLDRLNSARVKRGRVPLMDHIEVGLRLGERLMPARRNATGSTRSTPRLHFVRGHSVNRAGKTFWRAAHFRGNGDMPIVSKTVNVSAARQHLSTPEARTP